jgi:hypothetical protein
MSGFACSIPSIVITEDLHIAIRVECCTNHATAPLFPSVMAKQNCRGAVAGGWRDVHVWMESVHCRQGEARNMGTGMLLGEAEMCMEDSRWKVK